MGRRAFRMLLKFCRVRRCKFIQLMTTCLVLSVVMVCWQQLNTNVVSHIKSYSYRYLVNQFTDINKSFTIPREEARRFSDFPYLLDHPDKCVGQDVLLLLFVKSAPNNVERRHAIRSTWGNEAYIQKTLGVTVKVLFALGAPLPNKDKPVVLKDHLYGDIIQQDFLDTFHNLTLKLIMQFHWMHSHCAHARFLMTADDDIFVHLPNLVRYLQDVSSRGVTQFWVGKVQRGTSPIRSKDSKYYMSLDMYRWILYPDYTAGAGYVLSSDVADKVYQATLTLNASIYIDDVFMGICANAVGVTPQDHFFFSGGDKAPYHPCIYDKMLTSHGHVEDIYGLWKAATHPQVKMGSCGFFGRLYCTAIKVALLCRPYRESTYSCRAAFS